MTFYVGQKVIAVEDAPETWSEWWFRIRHPSRHGFPVNGQIYTVSGVYWSDTLILELAEIYAPREPHWDAGFLASGFRPVVQRKTDIGTFTEILRDARSKEPALIKG